MEPLFHEHRLRVRYAETDQMGVAHHASYLLYVEDSRTRLMADRGCSYAEFERLGWALPVRKLELRYRASASYDEELVVRTRVGRVGAASVTFLSDIVRAADGTLLATAVVELACIDMRTPERKPTMLPDAMRIALERDGGAEARGARGGQRPRSSERSPP
jgi:acyl-CoA thioester hydrolase